MKKLWMGLSIVLMFALAVPANAATVSQATLLFLKIAPGARPAGMGETFVALSDDATGTWWNPAGLAFQKGNEVTMMYSRWLPQFNLSDLYYAFVSGTYEVPEWGTFGANIVFLNLGETIRTNAQGVEEGTFSSYEMAITGTYGALVNDHLSMGIGLKLAYSNLSDKGAGSEAGKGTATAVALDIGLLYKATFLPGLSLGANLSNLGPKVSYIDRAQADPLPTNLKFGMAYKLLDQEYNKLTILSDVDKELVKRDSLGRSDEFYEALFSAWTDKNPGQNTFESLYKSMIWHVGAEY